MIFAHEYRRGLRPSLIWAGAVSSMTILCMALYPEMREQMNEMTEMFASLGAFTKAFGMDKISIGTAAGFYGVEIGSTLSLAGGAYAAITGATMLSKEENGHTAEFLLTHPNTRARVALEKLAALIALVATFEIVCWLVGWFGFSIACETAPVAKLALFHAAQTAAHVEIACLCFLLSAFMRRSGIMAGLAVMFGLYFINIMAALTDGTQFLLWITPYAYSDASGVFSDESFETLKLVLGLCAGALAAAGAVAYYRRKDIRV